MEVVIYVPNNTENVNLNVFNVIKRTNESRTFTKHISCDCKWNCDGRKFNQIKTGITINVNVSLKTHSKILDATKILFGMLIHVHVKLINI